MTSDGEQPFVDADTRGGLVATLSRLLQNAAPDSLIQGGASEDHFSTEHVHNYQSLQRRQRIYQNGGPITEFIDTRALMTYGTGTEFTTTEDTVTDDQGRTVDEWLADQFVMLDEHFIQRGIQTYVYGDAWPEIVESRGGGFSHVNLIDPTTVNPSWDQHGQITGLEQVVDTGRGQPTSEDLDDQLTGHYWFKKSISSGPLGTSLIEQNMDEIQRFASNQEQRANAIRLHGSPHYHISVGSEGQAISDRLMRRLRDRFSSDQTDEKTNWVTGGEVEISELDAPGFEGMESITQTDIALLSSGFGLPLEYTNFGSDGLGSGKPAESRQLKFERQARAEQRRAAQQFIDEIARPVLALYSPFPRDIDIDLEFGDVVSDIQSQAKWMRDFKSYLTPEEIRENLGVGPAPEDADLGPPEGTPDAETGGDVGGGLFATADDADAPDPIPDEQKHLHADGGMDFRTGADDSTGSRQLLFDGASDDALTREELVWEEVYDKVLWAGEDGDSRALFEFDPEEVPDSVIDRLTQAVANDAVFDQFETIPDWAASQVEDVMLDSLETRHGWSVDSIAQNLQDMALGLSESDARTIARTETQALVNKAREDTYSEQFDMDEERFRWVGPNDDRTTDTCEGIKDAVGDGVTLQELKDTVDEVARENGHTPREWTPHVNCRHTYVRVVE